MNSILRTLGRRHARQFIVIIILDILVFSNSDARTASSLMLMGGFLLLLATIYQLFYGLLAMAGLYGLKLRHRNRFAFYFTVVMGLVVALQSIGELSPKDVIVLLPLAALGYLYTSYGSEAKKPQDA